LVRLMKRMRQILVTVLIIASTSLSRQATKDVIVPNDSLVVEGIPSVPASLAKAVARYSYAYAFRLAGWDLTKREVLLKNLTGSETSILRMPSPGGKLALQILLPSGAFDIYYSPAGTSFLYNND